MPLKEKISWMSIYLDKSMGGIELGKADFNMADYYIGGYKPIRLQL